MVVYLAHLEGWIIYMYSTQTLTCNIPYTGAIILFAVIDMDGVAIICRWEQSCNHHAELQLVPNRVTYRTTTMTLPFIYSFIIDKRVQRP